MQDDLLYPDLAELDDWLTTAATATALRVRSPDFPAAALLARLAATPAPALRALVLEDCKLTAADLAALLASGILHQLHRLELADDTLDEPALRALATSPDLAALVHLRLEARELPVHSLVRNPALRNLTTLELPNVHAPADLAALLTAPFPAARAWRPRVLAEALTRAHGEPFLQNWDDLAPLVAALDATAPVPSDTPTPPVPSDTPTPPVPSDTPAALEAALARWPAYTRHALSSWLRAALTGPAPALRRAGNLDVHCLRGIPRKAEDLDALTALLAHPDAAHIRRVDLRYLVLPEDGLARWLRGPWLATIRALDLHGHSLTAPVLAALVDNPAAADLRALHLTSALRSYTDYLALLTSPLLPRLHALDLSCNALSTRDMRRLVEAPLAHLRGLNLRACDLTTRRITPLVCAEWPALERLVLSENHLDDRAARLLMRTTLPALRRLDLGYPKQPAAITDRGARHLAEAVSWASLQDLGLEFHHIADAGALALASSPHLPALRRLRVAYGNNITAEGAAALVAAAPPHLRLDIDIGCNHHLRTRALLASPLALHEHLDVPDPFDIR